MKRTYVRDVINEGGRLFGIAPTALFVEKRDAGVEAAESAIIYTLWLTHHDLAGIGRYCGSSDIMDKVKNCIACRKVSPDYNRLVGDLAWYAQRWRDDVSGTRIGRAA